MHLTSLPAVVAAALPHATTTTLEITLAPSCSIRVLDGPGLPESDIERIDTAILAWRAVLASQAGILVTGLKTEILLQPSVHSRQDGPIYGLREAWPHGVGGLFGNVVHVSVEIVDADGEPAWTMIYRPKT